MSAGTGVSGSPLDAIRNQRPCVPSFHDGVRTQAVMDAAVVGIPHRIVVGETVQFERLGYFCPDPESTPGGLVFNRALTLKDTWAKLQAQGRHDTA